MTLGSKRRALIVEDEYLFAMSLAVDMQALGFDSKRTRRLLAGNGEFARYRPDGR